MTGRARGRVVVVTALVVAAIAAAVVGVAPRGATGAPARAPATAALQTGPAPWAPEYTGLARRLEALRLPPPSDTAFHIHVLLRVYVDGRPVPIPSQIGIDPLGRFLAPLHTHDASGIVHVESARPYPFTLGQFFAVWGVRFGDTRLGAYGPDGARRLRVYVDGRRVARPAAHVLRAHDRIVVAYGAPGSSPTIDRTPFPAGL
jgi:hypothetical protein